MVFILVAEWNTINTLVREQALECCLFPSFARVVTSHFVKEQTFRDDVQNLLLDR